MTLQQEIEQILQKLALLSEAPAGQPPSLSPPAKEAKPRPGKWGQRRKSPTPHSGSRVPAGASIDRYSDGPPPKDRSLHDWYAWHFRHFEDDPETLISLLSRAEFEYRVRVFYNDHYAARRRGDLTDNDARDGGVAERAANKRVVERYQGVPAFQVALVEGQTERQIRKARREHNRDPEMGLPRPEFLKWSDEERRRRIADFEAMEAVEGRGVGNKSIARHFGVDADTIRRYRVAPAAPT